MGRPGEWRIRRFRDRCECCPSRIFCIATKIHRGDVAQLSSSLSALRKVRFGLQRQSAESIQHQGEDSMKDRKEKAKYFSQQIRMVRSAIDDWYITCGKQNEEIDDVQVRFMTAMKLLDLAGETLERVFEVEKVEK